MRHGTVRHRSGADRRDELRRLVQHQGYVSSRQVARELQVSDMTIRRDLDQLARLGLVLRVRTTTRTSSSPGSKRQRSTSQVSSRVSSVCTELSRFRALHTLPDGSCSTA